MVKMRFYGTKSGKKELLVIGTGTDKQPTERVKSTLIYSMNEQGEDIGNGEESRGRFIVQAFSNYLSLSVLYQ